MKFLHPQLDRVHLELVGQAVDDPFDEVDGLGDPERAGVGDAAGRLVGVDRGHLAVGGLEVVAAGEDAEEAGGVLDRGRGAVERAVVGQDVGADPEDLALLGGRDLAAHDVVAGEAGAHEVLEAVLHPLDRLAEDQRRDDRADVARVDRHLVAEAAADVRGDDADLVLGQAGDERVDRAVRVRGLAGGPQRQLAAHPLVVGHAATGLHRRRVHARVDDVLLHHDVGLGEHRLGGGLVAGLPVEAVVVGLAVQVGADHGGVGRQGAAYVDHRRQRVVLDVDQLEGVARGVAVLGHHEGDLLALEPHLVGGQHRLHVVGQGRHPGQPLLGQVRTGDDRLHLRVRQRGAGVDADDPGVRQRRAQDREVQHALQLDVVDVLAHAADEPGVLLAEHPAVAHGVLVVVGVLEVLGGGGDARLGLVHGGHDALPAGSLEPCSCWAAHCTERTMVV